MAQPSDFRRLGGKSQRFQNIKTGEIISRRQYNKQIGKLSFEELASINRDINKAAQLLRPARGRSSAVKLAPELKSVVAEAREEFQKTREEEKRAAKAAKEKEKELKKAAQQEARKNRTIEKKKAKKYRRRVVKRELLKPGHLGFRVPFNDYEEYEKSYAELRKLGADVLAYGLGYVFVDERDGAEKAVTTFRMMSVKTKIDEEEFYDVMSADLASRPYAIFLHYYMHVAMTKAFGKSWAESHGKKWIDK